MQITSRMKAASLLAMLAFTSPVFGCAEIDQPPPEEDKWRTADPYPAETTQNTRRDPEPPATDAPNGSTPEYVHEPIPNKPPLEPEDLVETIETLPLPAPPESCPTGLPWQIATDEATVTYVNDEDGEGVIEVTLDGKKGGTAIMWLPLVAGNMDITLDFADMQASPWGTYEIGVLLYDPAVDWYATDAFNNPTFFSNMFLMAINDGRVRSKLNGTVNRVGASQGGNSDFPGTHSFRVARNSASPHQESQAIFPHGEGLELEDNLVDLESPLRFVLFVRGNMQSKGAVVKLEGVRAKSSGDILYNDDFTCDSTTRVPFEDAAAIYQYSMVEGDGPRPEL